MSRTPYVPLSADRRAAIAAALRQTYFAEYSPEYLASDDGREEFEDHLERRYRVFSEHFVPWVQRRADLSRELVVEVGCGTGSSTVALGRVAQRVHAFEISHPSAEMCRQRRELLGLDNVEVTVLPPQAIQRQLELRYRETGVGVIVLYAVLEHMSLAERLVALANAWRLLRPGGLLVIGETPNRLVYFDEHTARLSFFNMLPDELALMYVGRSPRAEFVESVEVDSSSRQDAMQRLLRWGRGVSYHEFEIAIGDLDGLVVGDGFDPELPAVEPLLEEKLLWQWVTENRLDVHRGFSRRYLDLILRKPVEASAPDDQSVDSLCARFGLAPEQDSSDLVRFADQRRLDGALDVAERELDRALALDPACADAYVCRAWIRHAEGRLEDGLDAARRARELAAPGSGVEAAICDVLTFLFRGMGDAAGALVEADRLVELRPGSPDALVHRGWVHRDAARWELALADARAALELAPDNAEARELSDDATRALR